MLVNPDASQKNEVKTRQRASTSCTECRRRKQKCNQAKDRPCNNCSRRYPPVPCVYETLNKSSKHKGSAGELHVSSLKIEKVEVSSSLATLHGETDLLIGTPVHGALHSTLKLPTRSSSAASWYEGCRELGKDAKPPDPRNVTSRTLPAWDLSPAIRIGRYFVYPELFHSRYEYLETPTGSIPLEPLVSLPLEPSRRNAELFNFFIQRLSSFICSIDGNDPPAKFMNQWLPFMTQSPIAIYIAILTASYFQAASRQMQVETSVDAISAKGKLIALINTHIVTHTKGVNDESIAAVMSLAYNELVYSDEKSTIAHMRGLREMVKTRGGMQSITFPLLRIMLLRTDFLVACTLECPLFLHADELSPPTSTSTTYPLRLDCPLLLSSVRFIDNPHVHNIAPETAQILDDVRWLTASILQLSQSSTSTQSPEYLKFLATAQWMHAQLTSSSSLPLTPFPETSNSNQHHHTIHTTIQTTTLIFISSLLHRTPLSVSLTPPLLQTLWYSMWSVPLPVWKRIPGIFLYVLLVVSPGARTRPEGRFLKSMLAVTAIAIAVATEESRDRQRVGGGSDGVIDGKEMERGGWEVLKGVVGSVLALQKWLRGKDGVGDDLGSTAKRADMREKPEGGVPRWSIKE